MGTVSAQGDKFSMVQKRRIINSMLMSTRYAATASVSGMASRVSISLGHTCQKCVLS